MKKFTTVFSRLMLGACFVGALAACKKDDESPKGMSWTMDGSAVTAASTEAYTNTSGDLVIIGHQAQGNDYPEMVLVVPKRTGNSDQSNYDVSAFYFTSAGTGYQATDGKVSVDKYSTSNVAGSFYLTLEDGSSTKTLTDGQFDINY